MHFVIFLHVEVDGAIALIGEAIVENLLYELLLLYDMASGMRFYTWRQTAQSIHGLMVAVSVVLRHFHRLELFEACLLSYLVLALVSVVLKVTHVSDVSYVSHLVASVLQETEDNVEGDGRACVAEVRITVYGRSANVHAHMGSMERAEHFLLSCQSVVDV